MTEMPAHPQIAVSDDFTLSAAQMVFMINAENAIKQAEIDGDESFFVELVASDEYRALFGDMSIDQAIDRYESMSLE